MSTPGARKGEIVKNCVLVVISIIATLAVLEIGLRLFYPQPLLASDLFLKDERHEQDIQSRTARRALKPGVRCRHATTEFDVAVRVNSRGLRDREHSFSKPRGVTRILFVGDSFTFGYGVEESERFTNLLQRKLGARFEIINAGVPAWGTSDELLFLREQGLKYHPDAVVFCFYRNDVYDNIERELFRLKNDSLVAAPRRKVAAARSGRQVTRDGFNNQVLEISPDEGARKNDEGATNFWIAHFQLARLLRQAAFAAKHKGDASPLAQSSIHAQKLTAKLMAAARDDCRKSGARFGIVLIPDKGDFRQPTIASLRMFPVLQNALHDASLPLLDLAAAWSTPGRAAPSHVAPGAARALYFQTDDHLNKRGHAAAAQAMEPFVRALAKTKQPPRRN